MHQLRYLVLYRLDDGWMTVTKDINGDPCDEVKINLAFAVPHMHSFTTHNRDWLTLECSLIILLLKGSPISFTHINGCHARFSFYRKSPRSRTTRGDCCLSWRTGNS